MLATRGHGMTLVASSARPVTSTKSWIEDRYSYGVRNAPTRTREFKVVVVGRTKSWSTVCL
jgi:hypothetical protein